MTKADLVRSAAVSLGWKLGTTRGTEPEPTTTIVPVFRMPPASGAGDGVPLAPDLAVPRAPPQSQTLEHLRPHDGRSVRAREPGRQYGAQLVQRVGLQHARQPSATARIGRYTPGHGLPGVVRVLD